VIAKWKAAKHPANFMRGLFDETGGGTFIMNKAQTLYSNLKTSHFRDTTLEDNTVNQDCSFLMSHCESTSNIITVPSA
jgi:hypothetical protein